MRFSHSRRGLTLTEAAVVLAIAGIVLGSLWAVASAVYQRHQIKKATGQLQTIVSNMRALYGNRQTMQQISFDDVTADAVRMGVFPTDMELVGGIPQHAWGPVRIDAWGNCGGGYTRGRCDSGSFEVEFINAAGTRVPCAAFAASVVGALGDKGLIAIYTEPGGWRDAVGFNPLTIAAACNYTSYAFKL